MSDRRPGGPPGGGGLHLIRIMIWLAIALAVLIAIGAWRTFTG